MASTENDLFALVMLCTVLLSFGVLLMLGFCMFRAASRRNGEVDRLLDEVEQDEKEAQSVRPSGAPKNKGEWEKDGDWWKGDN